MRRSLWEKTVRHQAFHSVPADCSSHHRKKTEREGKEGKEGKEKHTFYYDKTLISYTILLENKYTRNDKITQNTHYNYNSKIYFD
jgi:hypothetical protein